MMKYFILISSMVFLASCNLMTRQDVKKEEEQKQIISTLQKTKADSELKYSDIQNDMRVIAGRVDALDHSLQSNQQASRQEVEALKKLVETQNEKIKLIQEHIDATEMRLTAAINAIKPIGGGSSVAASAPRGKEQGLLEEANDLLEARDFKKAIVRYQNYIDKNPRKRIGRGNL
ncbi:MAG: hypothetical protein IPM57_08835 [Oligoflexia bacterium]|nr:hypothetical protein [Oligoflexia bacterium]